MVRACSSHKLFCCTCGEVTVTHVVRLPNTTFIKNWILRMRGRLCGGGGGGHYVSVAVLGTYAYFVWWTARTRLPSPDTHKYR